MLSRQRVVEMLVQRLDQHAMQQIGHTINETRRQSEMTEHSSASSKLSVDLRAEIVGVDQAAPLLDGSQATYVNLDNAASTPSLRYVRDKMDEALVYYSSVHRGSGFQVAAFDPALRRGA